MKFQVEVVRRKVQLEREKKDGRKKERKRR